jgi:hypothetical protein
LTRFRNIFVMVVLAKVSGVRYVVLMPTIHLPTIDLTKIKLPFELPFDLPRVDLPSISVPTVDLAADVPNADRVIEWFRDAVYAGTGLVALSAERLADLQKTALGLVKAQLKR